MANRFLAPVLLATLFPSGLAAQAPKAPVGNQLKAPSPLPADISGDPLFQILLQNGRARVARVELAPNASTRLDAHPHDYILVSKGSSRLRVEGSSSAFDLDMGDDELQVIKGGWSHRLVNRSERPAELLLIEINQQIHPDHPTCGLNGSNCESVRFGKNDQGTYSESTLFETDTVRVLRAELGPGSTLSTHAHSGGHLIVPLHDADLETEAGLPPKNGSDPKNLAFWQADGPRALLNRGKSDASLLIVEVK